MRRPPAPLPVHVSDHAIVRYLERVGGFDIETLRAQIAARVAAAARAGATTIRIDGYDFVIARNDSRALVLTTVLEHHGGQARMTNRERGGA